jgi:hypothetical protein
LGGRTGAGAGGQQYGGADLLRQQFAAYERLSRRDGALTRLAPLDPVFALFDEYWS